MKLEQPTPTTRDPYSLRPADVRYDLTHGASRRILASGIEDFGRSLATGGRYVELGAGHYDHSTMFADRLLRVNLDPTQRPDVLADLHDLPFRDGSFDGGVCISVIEHVVDPFQVVREWARVTRRGGRVFAWIPFFWGVHGFPVDVSRFTEYGAVQLFERGGFEIERCDRLPYSGLFLNLSNAVHFVASRRSGRRAVRVANKVLFSVARLGFPLDRRLQLRTLYAGMDIVAVRSR